MVKVYQLRSRPGGYADDGTRGIDTWRLMEGYLVGQDGILGILFDFGQDDWRFVHGSPDVDGWFPTPEQAVEHILERIGSRQSREREAVQAALVAHVVTVEG